jgi:hypothetical protein
MAGEVSLSAIPEIVKYFGEQQEKLQAFAAKMVPERVVEAVRRVFSNQFFGWAALFEIYSGKGLDSDKLTIQQNLELRRVAQQVQEIIIKTAQVAA